MSRYKAKGGTPEVHNARSKLDGLLQNLLDKKDDSPIKEEALEEAEYSLSTPTTPKKGGVGSRTSRKRKRGKEDLSPVETSQYHHTYVMKLFDRSVDLAQFVEDSPLYPICRAWMKNQPHNRNLAPLPRQASPERAGSDEETDVDETGQRLVYNLPPPLPIIKEEGIPHVDLRIPAPIPQPEEPLDIYADASLAPPREHLLQNHMVRWKQIRQSWKKAASINESRYEGSFKILKEMFDRQCKDQ